MCSEGCTIFRETWTHEVVAVPTVFCGFLVKRELEFERDQSVIFLLISEHKIEIYFGVLRKKNRYKLNSEVAESNSQCGKQEVPALLQLFQLQFVLVGLLPVLLTCAIRHSHAVRLTGRSCFFLF